MGDVAVLIARRQKEGEHVGANSGTTFELSMLSQSVTSKGLHHAQLSLSLQPN